MHGQQNIKNIKYINNFLHTHTHTDTYIHIYIYIYIYISTTKI